MSRFFSAVWLGIALVITTISAADAARLDDALTAARKDDWPTAQRLARGDGEVAVAIIEWHRLRAGEGTFQEYRGFLQRHPDWPGLDLLRRRGEDSIPASADPREVIDYFLQTQPQTGAGAMRLAAAFKALGETQAATAEAIRAWTSMSLSATQESTLLAEYGQELADHHVTRVDNLLWRHRFAEAERMRNRVPESWRRLMDARIALRRDEGGVDPRIAAVPDDLATHPGLAFERMEWRARKRRTDGVVEILLASSDTADTLGQPEAWAKRRRPLARQLMRDGRTREASSTKRR